MSNIEDVLVRIKNISSKILLEEIEGRVVKKTDVRIKKDKTLVTEYEILPNGLDSEIFRGVIVGRGAEYPQLGEQVRIVARRYASFYKKDNGKKIKYREIRAYNLLSE